MFKLLMNAGLIIKIVGHAKSIIERAVRGPDHMPTKADMLLLLDDAEALCDSGLIQIPSVPAGDIKAALEKIEETIKAGG